ncbi:hypothetical protein H310_03274 [Aphanomyces invadans]|uniref:Uncharacterized protein n=1 Tax=Aphanomyces invadans TaxID=157072 RepID=A0A024UIU2_9STRA|nr:hypothetical protein H310_03274 [Aphanomyces invadans]ETW05518.1 hypothetical protein H310_03274 [Aphanomyces invadans]|eukprot:XP_008865295.1 hypothetical protein H310_03274 [Aphanomyces invadans]
MTKQHSSAAADDDAVVFNASAYSVVSSWISKSAITEEDTVAPKASKPLYTKSKGTTMAFATDEDKFLASKILKKKRQEVSTSIANDVDDDDDYETSFRQKGQSLQPGVKKQKTLSVQEKLLQSLREQQERRKLKNRKKNKK